ncbi:arginine--tRNA ligase [Aerococcus urinaehominis]|uniref:Arginine--tRNA ligase n=1 Tax=Aerococcus urinaehominis TaxID=128944 RepID=A0A120IAP8_9LACT|nr:arginine--tRNA ligase [Aerococcus urinaehominis]AMB98756.1 arginine--tRNA ligase [Aerococcus urinaehominis]SDM13903.1 arginyl-tRNA synthetase [Aerococcus urinaehominis]
MDFKHELAKAIQAAVADYLSVAQIENVLEVPKHSDHGDLAFPCFVLAKSMRKAPQMIANEIVDQIDHDLIKEKQVVGPYINFFLDESKISPVVLREVAQAGQNYGDQEIGAGENIVIDMSSPNIAKPMSMGHLRSTVIGNAIGNIVKKVGFTPVRINHLGDWGTQFGKLIVAYRKWGDEAQVKANPITELNRLYVRFHQEAEADERLDDEARAAFKSLEDGSQAEYELWQWMRAESLKEFERIYDLLGISFDSNNGEAFYNDKMDRVVDLLDEQGLLQVDQGATIVNLEKFDLNPALIKKSDGATLYITRDLAAAIYRKETYDFDQAVYVVGNEQSNHFRQLKAVLGLLGFEWAEDMHHVPFGLITQGGKKLSTRKGQVVLLEEVLNEAISLAQDQINQKNPDLANKDQVAIEVGVGAVVFHDLKNDRMNNFDFNLEEVVQFEGETGPYVQYANARAHSILRKADFNLEEALASDLILDNSEAYNVIKELNRYPEVIAQAYNKYEPSVIAKYLLQLAQAFNKYYAHVRILDQDQGLQARLVLVYCLTQVLENGLNLLGVAAPDTM